MRMPQKILPPLTLRQRDRHRDAAGDHRVRDELLQSALAYAARGWRVFPVRAAAKKPPLVRQWPVKATTDGGVIAEWWSRWPTANVAISTGPGSDLLVVDVDPRNGGVQSLERLQREIGDVLCTMTVRTPSGGTHFYFRYPSGVRIASRSNVLGNGIDVRGDPGYVLAPPSKVGSAPYVSVHGFEEPCHAPLSLIHRLLAPLGAAKNATSAAYRQTTWSTGERNTGLASLAGILHRVGLSPDAIQATLLLENKLRCKPPLRRSEVENIARSIARYSPGNCGQNAAPGSDAAIRYRQAHRQLVDACVRARLEVSHRAVLYEIEAEATWSPGIAPRPVDGETITLDEGETLFSARSFAQRHGLGRGDRGRSLVRRSLKAGERAGLIATRPAVEAGPPHNPRQDRRADPPPTVVRFALWPRAAQAAADPPPTPSSESTRGPIQSSVGRRRRCSNQRIEQLRARACPEKPVPQPEEAA
jgi:bifunctional DNA primase/polymerase-like protein/primase-like protein